MRGPARIAMADPSPGPRAPQPTTSPAHRQGRIGQPCPSPGPLAATTDRPAAIRRFTTIRRCPNGWCRSTIGIRWCWPRRRRRSTCCRGAASSWASEPVGCGTSTSGPACHSIPQGGRSAGTAAFGRVRPVPLDQRHRRAYQGGRPGQAGHGDQRAGRAHPGPRAERSVPDLAARTGRLAAPARIVTGRDGAGKLSVCDWFGSLARSSPCRKEVTTAWVSAVAWAAWTNSCCERRAASEVVRGQLTTTGSAGSPPARCRRRDRPTAASRRRQGDEDRRVGQRRVALVGPRRGVERSRPPVTNPVVCPPSVDRSAGTRS
jgi:hypothetical protein